MPFVTYDKADDLLKIRCRLCSYEWTQAPVDRGGTPGPDRLSAPGPNWVLIAGILGGAAVVIGVALSMILRGPL